MKNPDLPYWVHNSGFTVHKDYLHLALRDFVQAARKHKLVFDFSTKSKWWSKVQVSFTATGKLHDIQDFITWKTSYTGPQLP